MRKYRRQIAKERLTSMGVGDVNRKLHVMRDGLPLWKAVLTGAFGKKAEKAQMDYGKMMKNAQYVPGYRKLRKELGR